MASRSRSSLFALVHVVLHQLSSDQQSEYSKLHQRDRSIAVEQDLLEASPEAKIRSWIEELQSEQVGRMASAERAFAAACAIVGLLCGFGLAAGALYYDGSQPVNIVRAFSLLVVVPVALLLCTAALMLPERIVAALPGAELFADIASALHPSRVVSFLFRLLSHDTRQQLQDGAAALRARRAILAPLHRWRMLYSGQVFGVFFSLGVLAYCAAVIVFTDLAFVWSTTLQFDATRFHRLTALISWPWASFAPSAVPSLELIEQSRYFRFGSGALSKPAWQIADARLLTAWWPFLVMSVVSYVLIPRLLLAIIARYRTARIASRLLVSLPGIDSLFGRMERPAVSTQAVRPEVAGEVGSAPDATKIAPVEFGAKTTIVVWAQQDFRDVEILQAVKRVAPEANGLVFRAGGRLSLEEDAKAVQQLRATTDCDSYVVLVRGWEPPTAELFDFLKEMRAAIGPERLIQLAPVTYIDTSIIDKVDDHHSAMWQQRTAREADLRLQVRRWPEY